LKLDQLMQAGQAQLLTKHIFEESERKWGSRTRQ